MKINGDGSIIHFNYQIINMEITGTTIYLSDEIIPMEINGSSLWIIRPLVWKLMTMQSIGLLDHIYGKERF